MSYDSQPAGNIPLNCNRYQPGFPTLATSVSIKPLRSNGRVWFPCCDGVRFPSRPVLQIGKRSLHTGEVVGSIPTAPTILRALLGSIRQYRAEQYANVHARLVGNPWDLSLSYCGTVGKRLVRDEGVAGSNPATPASFLYASHLRGMIWGTKPVSFHFGTQAVGERRAERFLDTEGVSVRSHYHPPYIPIA
jgi:hypothetical protein